MLEKFLVCAAVIISVLFGGWSQAWADTYPLAASLGEIPFGPFSTDQTVIINATLTDISSSQSVAICGGICIGSAFSLGGSASTPTATADHYSFSFGNYFTGPTELILLAPGQTDTIIFGEYVPIGGFAPPGTYGFSVQLQVFLATPDRPLVGTSSFGGTWEVTPVPAALPLFATGLGALDLFGWRRKWKSAALAAA
jgi:hypothetical protein